MLALPPVYFARLQNSLPATPLATVQHFGTVVTGGAANTKGTDVQLIAAVTYDCHMITVVWSGLQTAATATNALLDIRVDPAGGSSYTDLIANLLSGWCLHNTITLPLFIPQGASVAARIQGQIASDTMGVAVFLHEGPSGITWPVFTRCDTYGADTATSSGLAHTPGTSGAESAWTNIGGSTTTRDYSAIFPTLGFNDADTTLTAQNQHWEVGYSSAMLAEFGFMTLTTEMISGPFPGFPALVPIPSATQLQVRAESSGTPESMRVAVHCLA